MEIWCESCGKLVDNEDSVYCSYCGSRFLKSDGDILKEICLQLKKTDGETKRFLKNQIKIAYITLLIAIGAFLIAIVAAIATILGLQPEQRAVGFIVIFFALFLFWYFIREYKPEPFDVDEIDE